ncbi:hypothetical protein [Nitrospira sp. M1]
MSSLAQVGSSFPNIQQNSTPPSFTATSNQLHARSRSLNTTNFTFVTAEGDRVSLSSASEVNTSFGTYTFQGLSNDQKVSIQGQQFSTSIQQHFNLLVEGDLNEQEQADIQAFLTSAQNILQELEQGRTEKATNAAVSLAKLETLSHAALFVRQSTSVSLATQSTRVAIPGGAGLHERARAGDQANLEEINALEYILGKLQKAQELFQLDPEQLGNRFPTFVTTLLKSLENDSDPTDSPPTLLEQFQKKILEALLEPPEHLKDQTQTIEPPTDQSNLINPTSLLNNEAIPNTTSPKQQSTHTP